MSAPAGASRPVSACAVRLGWLLDFIKPYRDDRIKSKWTAGDFVKHVIVPETAAKKWIR